MELLAMEHYTTSEQVVSGIDLALFFLSEQEQTQAPAPAGPGQTRKGLAQLWGS